MHVKVLYDATGLTRIRCPDPLGKCRITHLVDGKLNKLWIEGAGQLQGFRHGARGRRWRGRCVLHDNGPAYAGGGDAGDEPGSGAGQPASGGLEPASATPF